MKPDFSLLNAFICTTIPVLLLVASEAYSAPFPTEQQKATLALIQQVVANEHYTASRSGVPAPDQILNAYLESLDRQRNVLLLKDIKEFAEVRSLDVLTLGRSSPIFEIFDRYQERLAVRIGFAESLLDGNSSFGVNEDYVVVRSDAPWAVSDAELNDIWRARVRNDILSLSLDGQSRDDVLQTLRLRYEQLLKRSTGMDSNSIFALYVNAYLSTLDPHSGYFLPRKRKRRGSSKEESLVGIGVQLKTDHEFVAIKRVFAGSAADRSGALHRGDRIIGVGEGSQGKVVDIVGWTLSDAVDLIRGPEGSIVRLKVMPKGTPSGEGTTVVEVRRGPIKLEEITARKRIVEIHDGRRPSRIGVIHVPRFYLDYAAYGRGAPAASGTSKDVERLLGELKDEGAAGVVIDLRGNQGGALLAATATVGLFVESGPVVQVRDTSRDIKVFPDPDPRTVYSGPLVVLVDRFSASASEIFAAAIQDYQRGIVVGEGTWGKGTVQETFDLNVDEGTENVTFGQLVLTVAEYFRVNGESTQLRGVVPDIALPTSLSPGEYGERFEQRPLPGGQIPAVEYSPHTAKMPKKALLLRHLSRVQQNPSLKSLFDRLSSISALSGEKKHLSLQEQTRRAQRQTTREAWVNFKRQARIAVAPHNQAAENMSVKALWDELILQETARVLQDLIELEGGSVGDTLRLEPAAGPCAPKEASAPPSQVAIAQDVLNGSGLLWKVGKPGAEPSYVFGTIHLEDPRVATIPAPVKQVIEQSSVFVTELVMHPSAQMAYTESARMKESESLRDKIGSPLYERLAKLAEEEYGIPQEQMDRLKPWAVFTLLSRPKSVTGKVLDAALKELADAQHIPVLGLDSITELVSMLDDIPENQQVEILRDTICQYREIRQQTQQLIAFYLDHDLAAMARLNAEPHDDEVLFNELMERTLYRRNQVWATRLEPHLSDGRAFVAVGALHLPGERGLLSLLQAQGYDVSRVW